MRSVRPGYWVLKVYLTQSSNPVLSLDASSGGEQSGLQTKLKSLSSDLSRLAPAPDTPGPSMVARPSPPLKLPQAGSAPSLPHNGASHLQPSVFTGNQVMLDVNSFQHLTQFRHNSCQKLFACRCANLVLAEILQNYSPWRVLNTRYFAKLARYPHVSHAYRARENSQFRDYIEKGQTRYGINFKIPFSGCLPL